MAHLSGLSKLNRSIRGGLKKVTNKQYPYVDKVALDIARQQQAEELIMQLLGQIPSYSPVPTKYDIDSYQGYGDDYILDQIKKLQEGITGAEGMDFWKGNAWEEARRTNPRKDRIIQSLDMWKGKEAEIEKLKEILNLRKK